MSSVRARDLAFAHGDAVSIFSSARFHLTTGWTGLIGANGAGKSTLLRLIAGELSPTSGTLQLEPERTLAILCPQGVETPSREISELVDGADARAHRLFGQLALEPSELARWSTLSPGERKRWQIAAALWRDPEVLLLDEPTNHLDVSGREWLVSALSRFRGVGLIVSHDRPLLDEVTVNTLRIHRRELSLWPGRYQEARCAWELEAETLARARDGAKAQWERSRQQLHQARMNQQGADAQRSTGKRMKNRYDSDARTMGADFAAASAEKRHGRQVEVARRNADRALDALSSHHTEKALGGPLFVRYQRAVKPVLFQLEAAALQAGERRLATNVRLIIHREDRLQLSGDNGAGKTTLLNALIASARISEDRLLHLPQELSREAGHAELARVRSLPAEEKGRVLSLVAALGVDPDRLLSTAEPSPGESRKLALASGLGRHVWALLLDEPTNHLDLPAIERLESMLTAFPGALVLVTHDATLAARVTSRTLRIPDDFAAA